MAENQYQLQDIWRTWQTAAEWWHYRRQVHIWPDVYSTDRTTDLSPRPTRCVDDERIRKIVREEIAKLPIRYDVPDAPEN